ncbi:hypothetical protein [Oricola sp.]|uniref:hypothetical protein n=1 Tax=Oricola sp. TaxID=1979950 RepID=UPI003BAC266F
MDDVPRRPGPPRLLNDDAKTIDRFRQLGLKGASHDGCGRAFGVCKCTVRNFFNRCPHVKAVYLAALGEGRAARLAAKAEAAQRSEGALGQSRTGPVCPTCGRRADVDDNKPVLLTPAAIAEARKTLDDLIDQQLAGRSADGAADGR